MRIPNTVHRNHKFGVKVEVIAITSLNLHDIGKAVDKAFKGEEIANKGSKSV